MERGFGGMLYKCYLRTIIDGVGTAYSICRYQGIYKILKFKRNGWNLKAFEFKRKLFIL